MILGKSENPAVTPRVDRDKIRIIHVHINAVFFNVLRQIHQNIIVHIDPAIVGIHPEHIRKRSAGCPRFNPCPVIPPISSFDLNFGITQSSPVITDFLNACSLGRVPNNNAQWIRRSQNRVSRTGAALFFFRLLRLAVLRHFRICLLGLSFLILRCVRYCIFRIILLRR